MHHRQQCPTAICMDGEVMKCLKVQARTPTFQAEEFVALQPLSCNNDQSATHLQAFVEFRLSPFAPYDCTYAWGSKRKQIKLAVPSQAAAFVSHACCSRKPLQFAESGGYLNPANPFPTGIQQLADERAEEERKAKENEEKKAEAEWFWILCFSGS